MPFTRMPYSRSSYVCVSVLFNCVCVLFFLSGVSYLCVGAFVTYPLSYKNCVDQVQYLCVGVGVCCFCRVPFQRCNICVWVYVVCVESFFQMQYFCLGVCCVCGFFFADAIFGCMLCIWRLFVDAIFVFGYVLCMWQMQQRCLQRSRSVCSDNVTTNISLFSNRRPHHRHPYFLRKLA